MDISININILELVITGIVAMITLLFHEFAHRLAYCCLRDNTAKVEDRLKLNSFKNVDPFGLIMLLIVGFGWTTPLSVESSAYKSPRKGIIVSFAGPLANLILAFLTSIIYSFLLMKTNFSISEGLNVFLLTMIMLNINVGIFNLLPIPYLDGSRILGGVIGGKVEENIYKIEDIGYYILIILLILTPFKEFLYFISNIIFNGIFFIIELILR